MRSDDVLRVMDLFALEGMKVLFRIGVALIATFRKELKVRSLRRACEGEGGGAKLSFLPCARVIRDTFFKFPRSLRLQKKKKI